MKSFALCVARQSGAFLLSGPRANQGRFCYRAQSNWALIAGKCKIIPRKENLQLEYDLAEQVQPFSLAKFSWVRREAIERSRFLCVYTLFFRSMLD